VQIWQTGLPGVLTYEDRELLLMYGRDMDAANQARVLESQKPKTSKQNKTI
jgi:hypothetical protein